MNLKKKIVAVGLAASMAAVGIVGTSLAYFTDTKEKENNFTVGNVSIELTEPNWDTQGSIDAETVYAGEPLAKDPTVTVDEKSNPCFVRISVTGLEQFGEKGDIIYRTDGVDNKLGENWVKHTDGYYYYTKVMQNGDVTDALFDQIVMPTGLTGGEEALPINVKADAVQAQGARAKWADVEKMTVAEIADWFGTVEAADKA